MRIGIYVLFKQGNAYFPISENFVGKDKKERELF